MFYIILTFLIPLSQGAKFNLDGTVQLGPKWQYEYRLNNHPQSPMTIDIMIKNNKDQPNDQVPDANAFDEANNGDSKTKIKRELPTSEDEESHRVTVIPSNIDKKNIERMYAQPSTKLEKVKEYPNINKFANFINTEALRLFKNIKKRLDDYGMGDDVDAVKKQYEEKFKDFLARTQNHEIKTKLGTKRVIFNTVDTSNRIIERLIRYLVTSTDRKEHLRSEVADMLIEELEKKKDIENLFMCKKIKICRSKENFNSFLEDILAIITSTSPDKQVQIRDAFTEVAKNMDFSHVMDYGVEKEFMKKIRDIERYDESVLLPMFVILKNIIKFKNSPTLVVGQLTSRVNKTMALLEIFETFDTIIPPTDVNKLQWKDLMNTFKKWSNGENIDVIELSQRLADHIMKPIYKLKDNERDNFQNNVAIIIRP